MSTPVNAGTSGFLAAVTPWLPWAAGAVVLGTVGAVLGVTGVFGRPGPAVVSEPLSITTTATGFDCPGGTAVTSIGSNQRVLALARSEDGAFLQIRDPSNLSQNVWVATGVVTVDAGQSAIDSLDIASCPVTNVVVNAHEVAPPPQPQPIPPAKPGPTPKPKPVDNPPVVNQLNVSANPYCNDNVTVSAVVSDDHGVSAVTLTWSGASSGSASMTGSGSNWSVIITPSCSVAGQVTYSAVARDSAHQSSVPKINTLPISFFG